MPTFASISSLSIFVAFAMTVASLILLKPLAIRLGLVDEPGGRKAHHGAVPLIGGIAMFIGFAFALLTLNVSLSQFRCFIAGATLLVITGLLDDFHELTPRSRLFIQIFVGILMVLWGNVLIERLGNLFFFGNLIVGLFAFPLTVLAVVGVINAVNMTDGVDGLAGTIALIEFFYLAFLAQHAQHVVDLQIISLIIAVLLAFLCFNFPWRQKANVFMGDSGSMMLGFFLVWFCVQLSQDPYPAARPVTFLWILAIPLWDISYVVVRRLAKKASPFRPDRGHLHHYLLHKKFSTLQVNIIMGLMSFMLGLIGILGEKWHISEGIMFLAFVVLFALYYYILRKEWKRLPVLVK